MRRSLQDLNKRMYHKDTYPDLPAELQPLNYWFADSGRCILSIPRCLLDKAKKDMDMYEVALPVKYVMEKGYEMIDGHAVVDVKYDKFIGAVVDESYYEYAR